MAGTSPAMTNIESVGRVGGEAVTRHLFKSNGGLRLRLQSALRAKVIPLDGPRPRRIQVAPKPAALLKQLGDLLKDFWPVLAGACVGMAGIAGWLWRRFRKDSDEVFISGETPSE
jgi:LPXTG-motif cell wall-anchored protein